MVSRSIAGCVIALSFFATSVSGAQDVPKTAANVAVQFTFTSKVARDDPFNRVTLDVLFTDPAGTHRRVPAFWAGEKNWKVRYASPVVGPHRFRSECSDTKDGDLHGVEGTVQVEPYKGENPLYVHGPLRVAKSQRYLEHADETPFFWLGDTWWMGLSKRLAWPDEFQKLAGDRKSKGFNVVQIVAGLYPDMPAFDERGANEAGFPWEKEYARINPAYFDAADRRIAYLVEQGIVPCVVGAWGYHLPWLGQDKMRQHQRYLYARWGALPIVWCVAGELNLPYYLSPDFPNKGERQTAEWEKVLAYARSINAFDRPITAHPTGVGHLSMRGAVSDVSLLDFDMIQTPHGQMEAVGPSVEAVRFSQAAKPILPTVNAEPSYEMLFDKTPPDVVRRIFWVCWASGVKGYTYGANGIWQLNRRDKPYGNSPWGGGYGKIAWEDAMNLPGSTQVALGKKLLEGYAWQRFEAQTAWATWAEKQPADPPLGEWIWLEENAAADAPVGARVFRRSFELPADVRVNEASLGVTADDAFTLWLNGEKLGSQNDWRTLKRMDGMAAKLKPGRNVIAIRAENVKADVPKNPAGLICGLSITLEGGRTIEIKSDTTWRASREEPANWQRPEFDDSTWPIAKTAAPYGGGPWGKVGAGGPDLYTVPYAFGIAGGVRMVYVPARRAIALHLLEPTTRYSGFYFDPTTGDRTPLAEGSAGPELRVQPPPWDHDWVLVLEAGKSR
jgi:hypothetical protein